MSFLQNLFARENRSKTGTRTLSLKDRISNHTSVRIMEHAATLDLDQFENSAFYDKLERARQQTVGRTILLSQVLSQDRRDARGPAHAAAQRLHAQGSRLVRLSHARAA